MIISPLIKNCLYIYGFILDQLIIVISQIIGRFFFIVEHIDKIKLKLITTYKQQDITANYILVSLINYLTLN
jgi:hypothetical protein